MPSPAWEGFVCFEDADGHVFWLRASHVMEVLAPNPAGTFTGALPTQLRLRDGSVRSVTNTSAEEVVRLVTGQEVADG
jgi:hypothetical protein